MPFGLGLKGHAMASSQPVPLPLSGPVTGERRSLRAVRAEARQCMRCPLYQRATQTVFGAGPARARIMLVGEQPGDQEDRMGKPFVGPAGKLLDQALARAGMVRKEVYVTNVVKHFKWVPVQRRRLHQKPSAKEIRACRPWLHAELAIIRPEVVVALGATAARSLMGPAFRVTRSHGETFTVPWARTFLATLHPSAILRAPAAAREQMLQEFIADLRVAARVLRRKPGWNRRERAGAGRTLAVHGRLLVRGK